MLKKSLYIIPSNEKESEICDFIYQTSSILSEKNTVIVFQITNSFSIIDLIRSSKKKESKSLIKKRNKIIYFTPLQIIPFQRFKFIKKLNYFLNILGIRVFFFIKNKKFSKKILWMFFPSLGFISKYFSKKWFVIYDMIDYRISTNLNSLKKLQTEEKLLIDRANLITSISQSLKDKIKKTTNKKIHLVPQGFSLEVSDKKTITGYKKLQVNKPIIGFVGGINNRLDLPLLFKLITKNNQWLFVFVGPIKTGNGLESQKNVIKKILANKNVLHIKKQPKSKIASIISQFDVAMIPYDTSMTFNLYSYPMKVFEYFYIGKPVVSTPIQEFKLEKFNNLIYIEDSVQGFERQIGKILKKNWSKEKIIKQKKLAIENSWKNKIEAILNIIS